MLYRILTENKNYDEVKNLVCGYFTSVTIIRTNGVWKNESEHSLIIEIDDLITDGIEVKEFEIEQLCYRIKKLNQQDKILVQKINCDSRLV